MDNHLADSVKKLLHKKHPIKSIVLCKKESRNGTLKTRILVITNHRIFLLNKSPLCIDKFFYLIDLVSIELQDAQKLTISSPLKSLTIHSESSLIQVVVEIIKSWMNIFHNFDYESLLTKCNEETREQLRVQLLNNTTNNDENSADNTTDVVPFGNYSSVYRCMCDYYETPCLEEVIWDIETIYCLHDTKEFDFRDFENLEPRYQVPMIAALRNNTWFKSINFSNIKLAQANLIELTKVLRSNVTITHLNVSNTFLKFSHMEKICEALQANKHTQLHSINLSKNNLDDKSIQLLCSLNINWTSLNLAETYIPQNSILSLFNVGNKLQRITFLDLSRILFKNTGSQALLNFLSKPNQIETLILEFTDVPLENLFISLKESFAECLHTINFCGTPLSKKKLNETHYGTCKTFFSTTRSLHHIDLSYCHLTPDYLKQVLLGLVVNVIVTDVQLKLAGNMLDQRYMDVFEVSLPLFNNIQSLDISNNNLSVDDFKLIFKKLLQTKNLKKLYIGRNLLNNKTRSAEPFMDAIVNYLQDDRATIECLHMEDMTLRGDAFTFINHLGSDVTLLELNICGNNIGPTGGRLLSKALQVNNCLQTLMLDRNDLNINALQDIAHGLTRNVMLKNLPTPLYDIISINKNNPDKIDKLDSVLKKINQLLQRNNSVDRLLIDGQLSKQLFNYESLDSVMISLEVYASKLLSMQQDIDVLDGPLQTAQQLVIETRLFIETYKDIFNKTTLSGNNNNNSNNSSSNHNNDQSHQYDAGVQQLIDKMRIKSPITGQEFSKSITKYFNDLCPKHLELTKLKIHQDTLDPVSLVTNPTLTTIVNTSVCNMNQTSAYVLLNIFKNIAVEMTGNMEELMELLLEKEQEHLTARSPMVASISDNNKQLSTLMRRKKEQINSPMTDSFIPEYAVKTLKKARPNSILNDLPELPVTSASLEHLNLQRPKMNKKHKVTIPVLGIHEDRYNMKVKLEESSTVVSLTDSKQSVASSQDSEEENKT